jgi:hypothetical protein
MGRKSRDTYDDAVGLFEVETAIADTFEAEFPIITGRTVKMLSGGEAPDRVALIDGIETGVELTAIKAGSAQAIVDAALRRRTRRDGQNEDAAHEEKSEELDHDTIIGSTVSTLTEFSDRAPMILYHDQSNPSRPSLG